MIFSHNRVCFSVRLKDEYDLYKGGSYSDCKRDCSEDSECKGFEYRWGENQQCELWTSTIKSVEQEDKWDLDCCIKVYT